MKKYVLLCICILGIGGCATNAFDLVKETRSATHSSYTAFRPADASYPSNESTRIELTLSRPSRDDPNILLSVAGTYTSPQNTVEGFVILDGKIIQDKERQGWDGAAVFYENGKIEILQTGGGKNLTRAKLKEIAAGEGKPSLIQAHLLVKDRMAQSFKPQLPYKRRALVLFEDTEFSSAPPHAAIVESKKSLDLNEFAQDLAELGAIDAVNLDMGSWSEGWYRTHQKGSPRTIGLPSEETALQTNWIIFRLLP